MFQVQMYVVCNATLPVKTTISTIDRQPSCALAIHSLQFTVRFGASALFFTAVINIHYPFFDGIDSSKN